MKPTQTDIRAWLERRFPHYRPEEEPVLGTYGLIWFLNPMPGSVRPRSFAVKTLNPERLINTRNAEDLKHLLAEDLKHLRREFRMWLALPPTYNVVPALGLDVAILPSNMVGGVIHWPIIWMPWLSGSLRAWIGEADPGEEDRLIALAQAFHGLQYLYDHGFEGHGDLKPENILFSDLRDGQRLPEMGRWPSQEHPWRICISDLGWADAWVDLGFADKAWRSYLGPERLGDGGHVIPQKSDVFSMGVIASELLQGRHPAPNERKIKESHGKCRRWAEQGERILTGISSSRLRDLVEDCLRPDPSDRPPALECISTICEELRERYGHDIEGTLALWRDPSAGNGISEHEHAAWAAHQSTMLGTDEVRRSRDDLERRLSEIEVGDLGTCEIWAVLASNLLVILDRENPDSPRIRQLRDQATENLRSVLGPIDREALDAVPPHGDQPGLQAYERLSEAVGQMAEIAGIGLDIAWAEQLGVGQLTRSAWAFAAASLARYPLRDTAAMEQHLSHAIEAAPDEAVPYFFRAFWSYEKWLMSSVPGTGARARDLTQWIADLQTASRLRPSWEEPQQLLEKIRTRQF